MALVNTGDPIGLSFAFRDNNGNNSSTSLYLPPALSVGFINDAITLVRDPMVALTNATLLGANANIVYTEDTPIGAPPESEVERKLVLIFATTNRRQKVRVEVPSPVFGLEEPGTDAVSLTNPLVAAFGTAIIGGSFGPGNGFRSVSNGDIIALERAYIAHRTRRVKA